MPSARTLALRDRDTLLRLKVTAQVATCMTCGLPAGAIIVEPKPKTYIRLRNSNFVKKGDDYQHADRRICDAVIASRANAERRQAPTGGGQDDVPVVPAGASAPAEQASSLS